MERLTDDILDVRDYVLSRNYSDERLLEEYNKRTARFEEAALLGNSFDLLSVYVTKEGYRLACVERGLLKNEK